MRKLIRKGQVGLLIPLGGLNSFTPTPPNLASLIPGLDLSSFKLQALNPITKKTILGLQFTFNKNKGSNFSQAFNKTNIGSTANLAGSTFDMINSFLPYGKVEQSGAIKGISTGLNVVSDIASNIPGIGLAIGLGADVLNTVLNAVDLLGAKKADTITKNTLAFETVGASYGGTAATVDSALEKSGKKYGLMNKRGRRKANDEIARAKMQLLTMSEIADDATQRFNIQSSMSDINNKRYGLALQGGYKLLAVRAGKLGMKVITDDLINRVRAILSNKGMPQLNKLANGGKMNVIPDGALHARLNHMDVDNITKKGIPVITQEDGGEIIQHAEIEKNEIIFTKEVTDLLEQLYRDGSDEAAIEAGKLLAILIIENTLDNTGLMLEVV